MRLYNYLHHYRQKQKLLEEILRYTQDDGKVRIPDLQNKKNRKPCKTFGFTFSLKLKLKMLFEEFLLFQFVLPSVQAKRLFFQVSVGIILRVEVFSLCSILLLEH